MGIMENDETVTRRYFYSIKDIIIEGRCDCNGHADQCLSDEASDWKLTCQCKHNTMGISCGECLPLYNGILSFVSHFRSCPIFSKKGTPTKKGTRTKEFDFFDSFFGTRTKKGTRTKNGTPTKIIYVVSVTT